MSTQIDQERELYLYYYVFGSPEAKELMELWIKDILQTPHFQPQTDPNNTKTIRDMAILEFIQGLKNRVEDFEEKGVKDGTTDINNTGIQRTDAEHPANRTGDDTGSPTL